jgi:hypothetical protein
MGAETKFLFETWSNYTIKIDVVDIVKKLVEIQLNELNQTLTSQNRMIPTF